MFSIKEEYKGGKHLLSWHNGWFSKIRILCSPTAGLFKAGLDVLSLSLSLSNNALSLFGCKLHLLHVASVGILWSRV
jgi:hypothetical protein